MTQSKVTVNTDRLFEKVKRYFGGLTSAVQEMLQNARRAIANLDNPEDGKVWVTIEDYRLVCEDNGVGIADIGKALSLAESAWNDQTEQSEDPAGLGLCALLANCRTVEIESKFGYCEINGERFFQDKEYRESIHLTVDTGRARARGTKVTMLGVYSGSSLKRIVYRMAAVATTYRLYLNGEELPDVFEQSGIKPSFIVDGCEVYTDTLHYKTDPGAKYHSSHDDIVLTESGTISFVIQDQHVKAYGSESIPYSVLGLEFSATPSDLVVSGRQMCVKVPKERAGVVEIKLPDRSNLVYNEKTKAFLSKVFSAYYDHWIQGIREKIVYTQTKHSPNWLPHLPAALFTWLPHALSLRVQRQLGLYRTITDVQCEGSRRRRSDYVEANDETGAPIKFHTFSDDLLLLKVTDDGVPVEADLVKIAEASDAFRGASLVVDTGWPADIVGELEAYGDLDVALPIVYVPVDTPKIASEASRWEGAQMDVYAQYHAVSEGIRFGIIRSTADEISTLIKSVSTAILQQLPVPPLPSVEAWDVKALIIHEGESDTLAHSHYWGKDAAAVDNTLVDTVEMLEDDLADRDNPEASREYLLESLADIREVLFNQKQIGDKFSDLVWGLGLPWEHSDLASIQFLPGDIVSRGKLRATSRQGETVEYEYA